METGTKICLAILPLILAYMTFVGPYTPKSDPYGAIRHRMLVPGGETKWIEPSVELSKKEYQDMETQSYDHEADGNPEFLTVSMPFQITKARLGNRYWLDFRYKVSASTSAIVGNYTFDLILSIGDYQTRVPVEACVVEEMPPAPPRTPWFVSLMIPLSFVFFFALVYLGYQLVKGAIDRLRGR